MAKKMKKPHQRPRKKVAVKRRQTWCQMVIRVRVPLKAAPRLYNVMGIDDRNLLHNLEILNAYYDRTGQPAAW